MPLWNTENLVKEIRKIVGISCKVSSHPPGGDVDTFNIHITCPSWDNEDSLILCGFNPDEYLTVMENINISHVELININGKTNLYKNESMAIIYTKIACFLKQYGFEITDDLKQYF